MHVFLGVTGASGAPYAARLLRALGDAGWGAYRERLWAQLLLALYRMVARRSA